jgi:hypothetical protein
MCVALLLNGALAILVLAVISQRWRDAQVFGGTIDQTVRRLIALFLSTCRSIAKRFLNSHVCQCAITRISF